MEQNPKTKYRINLLSSSSQLLPFLNFTSPIVGDDDFQDYPSSSWTSVSRKSSQTPPLKPNNSRVIRSSKKPKKQNPTNPGKENRIHIESEADWGCGLDSIEPTLDLLNSKGFSDYLCNNSSIESKLSMPHEEEEENFCEEDFLEEGSTQLDMLLKLCADVDEPGVDSDSVDLGSMEEDKFGGLICCPLCEADISGLSDDLRQVHTNECLDKEDNSTDVAIQGDDKAAHQCPGQVVDGSPLVSSEKVINVFPVIEWLRNLGLAKYEEIFVREEIDWDALQCLTEEELRTIGVTALGPRKKMVNALKELRHDPIRAVEIKADVSNGISEETKLATNKLITDYFSGFLSERKRGGVTSNGQNNVKRSQANTNHRSNRGKDGVRNGKQKDVPLWCCIPGTPFRVDAFKYLRRDCSHWFLTHFHLDHYQGLTKSFCHGIIYCSSITAKLINMKIGIPQDKIHVLPLNQKINIAGTNVICFDANHCPGAIIILFEPPNGKPVLHTGDFRFGEEMAKLSFLQACPIHTLILDTTYCDPQYDFPKQEAVIQFAIDAIQAEAFNPKTLFLIGSYTIGSVSILQSLSPYLSSNPIPADPYLSNGSDLSPLITGNLNHVKNSLTVSTYILRTGKERLFIEVARVLRKKIYVTAAKLRLLKCLDLQQEDMQWFTLNEHESHIHVVPMWTIANFKRLKQMSNQYMGRFSLIVAFSPTGWSFGKGKKSTGRRWQQGTIIRYEVPYSEHSSFTELKEFVKLISPMNIIPSVNNYGPDSQNSMVAQLLA